jgi:hypothetical protein
MTLFGRDFDRSRVARGAAPATFERLCACLKACMRITSTAIAFLATVLLASTAFGRDHSDLNGTWTLVPAKSHFEGQPVVQTGTVKISEDRAVTVVTRSFIYEGATETYFYNDSAGSQYGGTVQEGKDLKSKIKWEGDVLKVTTTRSGAVTVESYSLAADGAMTVNVERPEHKSITLVFLRQ